MTQPPTDPAGRAPLGDATPTEPVPAVAAQAAAPAFATPAHEPGASRFTPDQASGAGPGVPPPPFAFAPAEPEPASDGPTPARVAPAGQAVSSRMISVALGAAILVGAVGIAFAAGRATAPVSSTANVPAAGSTNGGAVPGIGGLGNGGGIGPGTGNGGPGRPGDLDGGLGFDGRRGFGGFGLTGTVTALTPDSITVQTDAGPVVTFSLDGATTYHQQADASASDVRTGSKVQVTPSGRTQTGPGAGGGIDLGAADSITIVP